MWSPKKIISYQNIISKISQIPQKFDSQGVQNSKLSSYHYESNSGQKTRWIPNFLFFLVRKHTISLQDFGSFSVSVVLTHNFFREIATFSSRLLCFNDFFKTSRIQSRLYFVTFLMKKINCDLLRQNAWKWIYHWI